MFASQFDGNEAFSGGGFMPPSQSTQSAEASFSPSKARSRRRMGRKAGGMFINQKTFGALHKPCMKEIIQFLNCLALCQNNDEKCLRQKELLGTCMEAQGSKKKKPWGSINYHLQRLNKGRK